METKADQHKLGLRLLQLVADGNSARAIADRFGMDEENIKYRLKRIRNTLGADSTPQAVAMAIRRKLIE